MTSATCGGLTRRIDNGRRDAKRRTRSATPCRSLRCPPLKTAGPRSNMGQFSTKFAPVAGSVPGETQHSARIRASARSRKPPISVGRRSTRSSRTRRLPKPRWRPGAHDRKHDRCPAPDQMLTDVVRRRFNVSPSGSQAMGEFDAAGVTLISEQQRHQFGKAMMQMTAVFAEREWSMIRSRLMAGLDHVGAHRWAGMSRMPYGHTCRRS